eukprot:jgi/Botrbrau1/17295/Bobra.0015s0052.1
MDLPAPEEGLWKKPVIPLSKERLSRLSLGARLRATPLSQIPMRKLDECPHSSASGGAMPCSPPMTAFPQNNLCLRDHRDSSNFQTDIAQSAADVAATANLDCQDAIGRGSEKESTTNNALAAPSLNHDRPAGGDTGPIHAGRNGGARPLRDALQSHIQLSPPRHLSPGRDQGAAPGTSWMPSSPEQAPAVSLSRERPEKGVNAVRGISLEQQANQWNSRLLAETHRGNTCIDTAKPGSEVLTTSGAKPGPVQDDNMQNSCRLPTLNSDVGSRRGNGFCSGDDLLRQACKSTGPSPPQTHCQSPEEQLISAGRDSAQGSPGFCESPTQTFQQDAHCESDQDRKGRSARTFQDNVSEEQIERSGRSAESVLDSGPKNGDKGGGRSGTAACSFEDDGLDDGDGAFQLTGPDASTLPAISGTSQEQRSLVDSGPVSCLRAPDALKSGDGGLMGAGEALSGVQPAVPATRPSNLQQGGWRPRRNTAFLPEPSRDRLAAFDLLDDVPDLGPPPPTAMLPQWGPTNTGGTSSLTARVPLWGRTNTGGTAPSASSPPKQNISARLTCRHFPQPGSGGTSPGKSNFPNQAQLGKINLPKEAQPGSDDPLRRLGPGWRDSDSAPREGSRVRLFANAACTASRFVPPRPAGRTFSADGPSGGLPGLRRNHTGDSASRTTGSLLGRQSRATGPADTSTWGILPVDAGPAGDLSPDLSRPPTNITADPGLPEHLAQDALLSSDLDPGECIDGVSNAEASIPRGRTGTLSLPGDFRHVRGPLARRRVPSTLPWRSRRAAELPSKMPWDAVANASEQREKIRDSPQLPLVGRGYPAHGSPAVRRPQKAARPGKASTARAKRTLRRVYEDNEEATDDRQRVCGSLGSDDEDLLRDVSNIMQHPRPPSGRSKAIPTTKPEVQSFRHATSQSPRETGPQKSTTQSPKKDATCMLYTARGGRPGRAAPAPRGPAGVPSEAGPLWVPEEPSDSSGTDMGFRSHAARRRGMSASPTIPDSDTDDASPQRSPIAGPAGDPTGGGSPGEEGHGTGVPPSRAPLKRLRRASDHGATPQGHGNVSVNPFAAGRSATAGPPLPLLKHVRAAQPLRAPPEDSVVPTDALRSLLRPLPPVPLSPPHAPRWSDDPCFSDDAPERSPQGMPWTPPSPPPHSTSAYPQGRPHESDLRGSYQAQERERLQRPGGPQLGERPQGTGMVGCSRLVPGDRRGEGAMRLGREERAMPVLASVAPGPGQARNVDDVIDLSASPRHHGGPCDRSDPYSEPAGPDPWWHVLPDFVPVAAIRHGIDPRNGARVHIDYALQFSGAPRPRAARQTRSPKPKDNQAGRRKPATKRKSCGAEGAPKAGRWLTQQGQKVFVTSKGVRKTGQDAYREAMRKSKKA